MAEINSTARATADVIQISHEYCISMEAFFELAEREIKEHNSTDWDAMRFLVNGAKAECRRFSSLVVEIEEQAAEVSHG